MLLHFLNKKIFYNALIMLNMMCYMHEFMSISQSSGLDKCVLTIQRMTLSACGMKLDNIVLVEV